MNGSLPLPPVLAGKLRDFRKKVWLVKLAEGLLAALVGLALSYLLVLGLDRIFDTPPWLRGLILVAGVAGLGLGLPLKWHRWVWRQRRLEDAARLLRWKFPRLGDQLLGIVELAKQDSTTGRSERLVSAAMAQAEEAVSQQDFSDAVPRARHGRWAIAATAAIAVVLAGFLVIREAANNALPRWMMPWKATERFTFARVEPLPNPLVVPLAEPFQLPVTLSGDTRWKPGSASGKISGQPLIQATREQSAYSLAFPPQREDTSISLKVGDVRESLTLEPRPRPELTNLRVRLKLPDYLHYKTEPVTEVRSGSVSLLKGAIATFEAEASRELAIAEIDGQVARTEGARLISSPSEVAAEREVKIAWKDKLGLSAASPLKLKILPLEDEAPKIVARRESLEQVVLDSEVLTFEVSASDDFGVRQIGLEWHGLTEAGSDIKPAKGSKVASAGGPEKKQVDTRATFSAKREGVEPQTLELRAWAEDYLSGRERSRGAVFVLHILNPEDHAMWVTQQMAKWLEAAKETYEREQQLHATNKELREMDATALDRPENRRKVAQQASAETANGERLASLTNAGSNLVEQATKNPEFDAKRLESWALMLRSLRDISANRMPSVADLLKQAADAKMDLKLAMSQGTPAPSPGKAAASVAEQGKPGESTSAPTNQPGNGEGKQSVPGDSKSAPQLSQGPSSPKGNAPPSEPSGGKAPPAAPSIAVKESTMYKPGESDPNQQASKGKPSAAVLTLPSNTLAAPPKKQPGGGGGGSAQDNLDEAVTEQQDLLAEFAKVADQLGEILASLESSTFVKRFKAASRKQTELASGLSQQSLDAFGVARANPGELLAKLPDSPKDNPLEDDPPDPPAAALKPEKEVPFVTAFAPVAAKKAKDQGELVKMILNDLEAYFQRRQDLHFKKVIGEMKQTRVVQALSKVGEEAEDNYSGNAIHGAEYWADTLDRWAEEMVAVGKAFC